MCWKKIPVPVPPGHKYCHSCSTVHPLGGFYRNRSTPDGLTSQCRECAKVSGRKSRAMQKLIEETAEEMREFLRNLKPYEAPVPPMSVPYP